MSEQINNESLDQNFDQLSWEMFYKHSSEGPKFPKKVSAFNRLIAHTKNFFVISGYGAFTPGYLIIITKEFIPSFSMIEKESYEELDLLIDSLKKFISKYYNRKVAFFEHGMCACIGGLDRAHLHIMSLPNNTTSKDLEHSINSTLESRKAGIDHILYKGYKLENKHDIESILQIVKNKKKENSEIKIIGKLLKFKNIQNLDYKKWPFVAYPHVKKGGHYVYFNSSIPKSSFLTTHNFQTQMGREIVFKNEMKKNKKFQDDINKDKNFSEKWKWQNMLFEENIIATIKDAKNNIKPSNLLVNNYRFKII